MELKEERRKMKKGSGGGSFCIPGLRGNRVSPTSLLERFRRVVFRLIMLSAISKTQQNGSCCGNGSRPYPRADSHYSEAVADCIEFIKKSAPEEAETATESMASSTGCISCHLNVKNIDIEDEESS